MKRKEEGNDHEEVTCICDGDSVGCGWCGGRSCANPPCPPFAQTGFSFFDHDDHWGSEHWEEVRRIAQDYGFRDGAQDGRNDFFSHRDFRPARNGSYKHADHGYERRFGDKGRYKDIYREAYQRGYEDGYRGHGGPFHGDRDHDR